MIPWVEAMRLRTLPVSVAGVVTACGYALIDHGFAWLPALLCLVFAVLAQIASNFANEYYDYKKGLDAPGRVGPRRGVTEGDISPRAMAIATYVTLGLACAVGLTLVHWGGWGLILAGVFIAVGVIAYSSGPWPLSHHAMGEVAVVFFFGIIPVNLTYMLQTGHFSLLAMLGSVSIGLLGANVLIVNNYRDCADDAAVGKHTLAVRYGRELTRRLYLAGGVAAVALMAGVWLAMPWPVWVLPLLMVAAVATLYRQLGRAKGRAVNPLLGLTAVTMLAYAAAFAVSALLCA